MSGKLQELKKCTTKKLNDNLTISLIMQYCEYITGETMLMWYGKFLRYSEI